MKMMVKEVEGADPGTDIVEENETRLWGRGGGAVGKSAFQLHESNCFLSWLQVNGTN